MTETEEDWVQLAMGDTCLVAHLLLRLVGDSPPSSRTWLDWTVRGRRSSGRTKKEPTEETERGSPSTPLSWSGATSTSRGRSEEWQPWPLENCHEGRSKPTFASGVPVITISPVLAATPSKRLRQKKKSLFELKDQESLLLKERHCLKQELASLRLRVEEERATNESLKRMKVNYVSYEQQRNISQSHAGNSRTLVPDLNLPLDEP